VADPKGWRLAQMNVASARWDMDQPEMTSFVEQIAGINAMADASPGFVWRWTGQTGDPRLLVNISVWESVEALKAFTYRSSHATVFRDRARWFDKAEIPNVVLWWVPVGHQPTLQESMSRLKLLHESGPTPDAFTFAHPFNPRFAAGELTQGSES
jgi:heme-degrading monooxygenase HmoA